MQIGKIKVLRSNAGYYIGTECLDDDIGCEVPYERLSGYYPCRGSADVALAENDYSRP